MQQYSSRAFRSNSV